MQFPLFALLFAFIASVFATETVTVTVTVCAPTNTAPVPSGYTKPTGGAYPTSPYSPEYPPAGQSGGYYPPTPSSSHVPYEGAASSNGANVAAAAMIAAGGLALFI